jgi:hypothetical protein
MLQDPQGPRAAIGSVLPSPAENQRQPRCAVTADARAAKVSRVGKPALIEREGVTLPLDHAFGLGPAAIEVQRQCRRADAFIIR